MLGVKIEVVKPGTMLFSKTGEPLTVTDEKAVTNGQTMYVTKKTFNKIKEIVCQSSSSL